QLSWSRLSAAAAAAICRLPGAASISHATAPATAPAALWPSANPCSYAGPISALRIRGLRTTSCTLVLYPAHRVGAHAVICRRIRRTVTNAAPAESSSIHVTKRSSYLQRIQPATGTSRQLPECYIQLAAASASKQRYRRQFAPEKTCAFCRLLV
ncbi:hypothetical protein GGH95_004035, partial [Coemansia sp. RSA 1836]